MDDSSEDRTSPRDEQADDDEVREFVGEVESDPAAAPAEDEDLERPRGG